MGRLRKKRMHVNNKETHRKYIKTRNRAKDTDQVYEDLEKPEKFENMPVDPELPGLGQHYCISCAKYFIDRAALDTHNESRPHKRRLKTLASEGAYSQAEADAAAGMGSYAGFPTKQAKAAEKKEEVVA
eukprot:Colp12_sorted_trinity150504_noHs@13138